VAAPDVFFFREVVALRFFFPLDEPAALELDDNLLDFRDRT